MTKRKFSQPHQAKKYGGDILKLNLGLNRMYRAWGLINDELYQGCIFEALCEVLCDDCYNKVINDEDYFPAPYTYYAILLSKKPLKCDMCGKDIKRDDAFVFVPYEEV